MIDESTDLGRLGLHDRHGSVNIFCLELYERMRLSSDWLNGPQPRRRT